MLQPPPCFALRRAKSVKTYEAALTRHEAHLFKRRSRAFDRKIDHIREAALLHIAERKRSNASSVKAERVFYEAFCG